MGKNVHTEKTFTPRRLVGFFSQVKIKMQAAYIEIKISNLNYQLLNMRFKFPIVSTFEVFFFSQTLMWAIYFSSFRKIKLFKSYYSTEREKFFFETFC